MRILFTLVSGTGHLHPLAPFAIEMKRRGHEVRMATTPIMSERIAALGLEHRPVGDTTDEEDKAFFSQYAHLPPNDRVPHIMDGFFGWKSSAKALPDLRKIAEDWKPDPIVREEMEYGGLILSELTGNSPFQGLHHAWQQA